MANGYLEAGEVTLGSGKKAATYTFTEDALLKFIQRIALADQNGADAMGLISDPAWSSGNGQLLPLMKALATAANNSADVGTTPHQPCDVITFTPAVAAAAYTSGNVLFITTALTFARAVDTRANLVQITAIDKAKQNAAITLLFYQANVTSAAINTANALSDTDQLTLLGSVDLAAADWKTWANNSTLCYSGAKAPNLLLEPVSTTQLVYVVGIVTSTPTFSSTSDLTFKLGFVQQ